MSRSGGSAWEREKPLPPPGAEPFEERVELLKNLVLAMRLLQPCPADLVIDLEASTG